MYCQQFAVNRPRLCMPHVQSPVCSGVNPNASSTLKTANNDSTWMPRNSSVCPGAMWSCSQLDARPARLTVMVKVPLQGGRRHGQQGRRHAVQPATCCSQRQPLVRRTTLAQPLRLRGAVQLLRVTCRNLLPAGARAGHEATTDSDPPTTVLAAARAWSTGWGSTATWQLSRRGGWIQSRCGW